MLSTSASVSGRNRAVAVVLAVVGLVAVVLRWGAIDQPAGYHDFADQVTRWGIPHAADVLSNLGFLLVGLAGLVAVTRRRVVGRAGAGYLLFFVALIGTAFGSAYYHLAPDDNRLVFDRLPIALAAAGLLAAEAELAGVVADGVAATVAGALFAAWSVVWWHFGHAIGEGDLRPYLLLQLAPLVCVPWWQYRARVPGVVRAWYGAAMGLYVLAKLAELADGAIWRLGYGVSGHTLKHVLATLAVAAILVGWRKRMRRVRRT